MLIIGEKLNGTLKKTAVAIASRLCEEVGDGGGFNLSTGCEAPVDSKPEYIRAMIDAGKTYGVYN